MYSPYRLVLKGIKQKLF